MKSGKLKDLEKIAGLKTIVERFKGLTVEKLLNKINNDSCHPELDKVSQNFRPAELSNY